MEHTFDVTNDLAPQCTITVRVVGINKWRVRVRVASKIIKLAAFIMNVGLKFEDKPWYGTDL